LKARLEHVFAYLDREKIKRRVRQLSSRSANGDSLFKSQSSQNFERLLAQERSFRSPATRKEEDKRMWNDFFSAPTDQKERSVENSDDTNEARLTYIEVCFVNAHVND
jgi:O-methyltransferase involved in polyketide biosynthesis